MKCHSVLLVHLGLLVRVDTSDAGVFMRKLVGPTVALVPIAYLLLGCVSSI